MTTISLLEWKSSLRTRAAEGAARAHLRFDGLPWATGVGGLGGSVLPPVTGSEMGHWERLGWGGRHGHPKSLTAKGLSIDTTNESGPGRSRFLEALKFFASKFL